MILPGNPDTLSDEELLSGLVEIYEDAEVAQFVFDVVRGNIELDEPLL